MTTGPDRYSTAAGKTCLVVTRTLYLSSFSAFSIQATFCWVVTPFSGLETKFSV